jgi:hypothetical protein
MVLTCFKIVHLNFSAFKRHYTVIFRQHVHTIARTFSCWLVTPEFDSREVLVGFVVVKVVLREYFSFHINYDPTRA